MARDKMKINADNSWGWALFVVYFGALVYFVERNEGFSGVHCWLLFKLTPSQFMWFMKLFRAWNYKHKIILT
jgi:hypothetical protein